MRVGEAVRIRAVVRAQADDDRRGRDLRHGRAEHLEALRRGATGAGVPRDLAVAEHGDQEGPHAHGERVADHEHGALRRARRGAREGDDRRRRA